jgi:hypothetical protein
MTTAWISFKEFNGVYRLANIVQRHYSNHRIGLTKKDCGAASRKFGIIARHGLSRLRVKRTLHLLFALELNFGD